MIWGLTAVGFNVKPQSAILTDMQTVQLAEISASLDISPDALMGILNGIMSQAFSEGWQMLGALYSGADPTQATGDQLTSVCLLTGTERSAADKSIAKSCVVNVNAGFAAAAGTMFARVTGVPAALFTNLTDVSNPGGVPANETVDFIAVTAGPTQCLAHTLQVAQPLSGWNTIDNPTDALIGTNIESDPHLRAKRELELAAAGSTTHDAIRSDVLSAMQPPTTTTETLQVRVLYNNGDTADANGLPGHSVEAIVFQPGSTADDDVALATLLLNSAVAAGVGTYGLASKVVKDSEGNSETVRYTRPAPVPLYIAITVTADRLTFPADGPTQIKNALLNYGALEYLPGITVYVRPLSGSVFPSPVDPAIGVVGVLDVTDFKVDTIPVPVNAANLPIALREIATLDSARITVTVNLVN